MHPAHVLEVESLGMTRTLQEKAGEQSEDPFTLQPGIAGGHGSGKTTGELQPPQKETLSVALFCH